MSRLFEYIDHLDLAGVKACIARGESLTSRDTKGNTLLMHLLLVDLKQHISHDPTSSLTAEHLAKINDHLKSCQDIMATSADTLARDIHAISHSPSKEVWLTFFEEFKQALSRQQMLFDYLLAADDSPDISTTNPAGANALHLAAQRQLSHFVSALLAAGCPVDSADKEDKTPLIYLAYDALLPGAEALHCAEKLLAAGANPEHRDKIGMTALKYTDAGSNHALQLKLFQSALASRPPLPPATTLPFFKKVARPKRKAPTYTPAETPAQLKNL